MELFFQKNNNLVEIMYWEEKKKTDLSRIFSQKDIVSGKNLPLKKHGDERCHLSWGVICFSYILLLLDFSCI